MKGMNRCKKFIGKISLTISFSIIIFIINLITTIIAGGLVYFLVYVGIVNDKNIQNKMLLPIITLISCIIIGIVVSTISSRIVLKRIIQFIEATAKLSRGDFTTRLNIKYPPEFIVLSKNFNLMAEELGSMEVLRTDFINNFSHEFKTPIISIKGFAEILKDDTLSKEERDEYLDIIIEESQRLSYLATNVLNLSKIEGQAILKDKQKFNVGEQIRQNILLLEPKFKDKNISLNIDIDDCILIGNTDMLSHVWLNLLGNSIKFINDNGVIRVIVKKRDDNIIMIFSDNGIGLSENVIPKIFDKFYQGDTSHATKGNGLGLTMVKKIVELHSGTIKCESVLSKGTKFTITLPIE